MVTAFGPRASAYAKRLPADLEAVVCDGSEAAEALALAVRRRREGIPSYVLPLMVDQRAAVARAIAYSLMSSPLDADQLRSSFEQLASGQLIVNGGPVTAVSFYLPNVFYTLRELMLVGDALLVRSLTERARLDLLRGKGTPYVAVAPFPDPDVPDVRADRDADRIVVWGPTLPVEQIAIYAYALSQLRRPAAFVCHGSIGGINAEFVAPETGADILRRAALVVDTSLDDPGTAIAFAQRGIPVVAAATAGAHEFLAGITTYDPCNFAAILSAVSRGRAGVRPIVSVPSRMVEGLGETLAASQPAIPADGPRISVVVPTYNRRSVLPRCLRQLAKQTYPNLEVVVLNDGGEAVDDIVAPYPFVTFIDLPANVGVVNACNTGVARATGDYVALLADDDLLYPDHFARLAQAAVASGSDVVHSNRIVRLVHTLPDGREGTFAHRVTHFGALDPLEAFWACHISLQGMIVRRSLFASETMLTERWPITGDYEIVIRLSKVTDFVHVDTVSAEMVVRDDRTSHGLRDGEKSAQELAAMLEFHRPPGRPLLVARQQATVSEQARHHAETSTFFAAYLHLNEPVVEVF